VASLQIGKTRGDEECDDLGALQIGSMRTKVECLTAFRVFSVFTAFFWLAECFVFT